MPVPILSTLAIDSAVAVALVDADPTRTGLVIQNRGPSNIYVGPDSSVTVQTGALIQPNSPAPYFSSTPAALYGIGQGPATIVVREAFGGGDSGKIQQQGSPNDVLTDAWDTSNNALRAVNPNGSPIGLLPGVKAAPAAVAVTITTPVLLAAASQTRYAVTFVNLGPTNTIYLGRDSTVTIANGYPLPVGQSFTDTLSGDAWYGVAAVATCDVRVLAVNAPA